MHPVSQGAIDMVRIIGTDIAPFAMQTGQLACDSAVVHRFLVLASQVQVVFLCALHRYSSGAGRGFRSGPGGHPCAGGQGRAPASAEGAAGAGSCPTGHRCRGAELSVSFAEDLASAGQLPPVQPRITILSIIFDRASCVYKSLVLPQGDSTPKHHCTSVAGTPRCSGRCSLPADRNVRTVQSACQSRGLQ